MPCPECGKYHFKPRAWNGGVVLAVLVGVVAYVLAGPKLLTILIMMSPLGLIIPVLIACVGPFVLDRKGKRGAAILLAASSAIVLVSAFWWAPVLIPDKPGGVLILFPDITPALRRIAVSGVLLLITSAFFLIPAAWARW